MRKRFSPATGIASAALFFSLGGTGMAASHYLISSTSQIKPSVLRHLHGARGSQGPRGSQGAQGIQGPQGLPGTQAPAAVATQAHSGSVTTASTSTLVAAGQTAVLRVSCPASSYASGGGYAVPAGVIVLLSQPVPIYADTATGGTASDYWLIQVLNQTAATANVTAYAACAR